MSLIYISDAATALDTMLEGGARLPVSECQARLATWRLHKIR
ncbi:hypothetical protein [Pseudomonas gessardii]|nr:hypothetical protein [Pseudomonas gessardii]